jgi:hypothetical protein
MFINIPSLRPTLVRLGERHKPIKDFMQTYQDHQKAGRAIDDKDASQRVRLHLSDQSGLSPNPNEQIDAQEGLMALLFSADPAQQLRPGEVPPPPFFRMDCEYCGRRTSSIDNGIGLHPTDPKTGNPLTFSQMLANRFRSPEEVETGKAPFVIKGRQTYHLEQPPSDLLITINRSTFDPKTQKSGKYTGNVDAPDAFQMPKDYYRSKEESANYECDGFIVHNGSKDGVGHYFSYLKVDGKWYRVGDQNSWQVSDAEVREYRAKAYILHYKKK